MIDPIATKNIVQTVSSVIVNVYPGVDGGIPAWVLTLISSGAGLSGVLLGTWLQIRADRKTLGRSLANVSLAGRRERDPLWSMTTDVGEATQLVLPWWNRDEMLAAERRRREALREQEKKKEQDPKDK